MNKKLNFAIEDVEFLDDANDSQFATAKIEAFSSGDNLHDLSCNEEVLMATAYTLYEKPVIFEVDEMFGDFGSHDEDTTVPAGFVVPDTAEFFKRDDGRMSLRIVAKIWKRYAKEFMDIFNKSAKKNKSVSVEMEIYELGEENESGVTPMLSFAYTAITVLGDFVTPASPDANMQMISFSNERKAYKQALRAEFGKYDELDFAISSPIKKNAKEGLKLVSENPTLSGITAVSKSMAGYLAREKQLSPEKAIQIAKYFGRKDMKRPSDKTGTSWIAWQLYGGSASAKLCRGLHTEMSAIDDELMTYFENHATNSNGGKEQSNMKKKDKDADFETEAEEEEDENVMMENDADEADMAEDEADMAKDEADMAEDEADMAEDEADMAEDEADMMKPEDEADMMKPEDEADMAEDEADEEEEDEEEYSLMGSLMSLIPDGNELHSVENASEESVFACISDAFEQLKSENEKLSSFKKEVDDKRFSMEVSATLKSVEKVLSSDKIEELREKSKEFSAEELNGWKNMVKALAFEKTPDTPNDEGEPEENDDIVVMGLPIYGNVQPKSIWD